ncbi:hypothetical protein GCM10020358_58030 [Amorphoplanes nipponensis]|uniref:Bacterial transcriptional activator domain-containing protein n=1 Tax=Actinoplanes nipponensis TaxID=135950 RepID=A0A919MPD9_9ACTN|nr:BTAD domain-containing putative transcriptional regulator [Actinoplanes nipponensis]GIE52506.1 hypothetical protein Ani05nite_60400 [Actinoplanes nipponensis]
MLRVLAAGGRLLRALVASATLVGFLVGVPWLLVQIIGWPFGWIGWAQPGTLPGLADLSTALTTAWYDDKILALLATVGWFLWALFCRDVLVEVIEASAVAAAARRGQSRPPVPGRGPIRWVAAVLVGAIVGAVLFDAMRGIGAAPSATAAVADAAARRPAVAVAAAPPAVTIVTTPAHTGPRPALTAASITTATVTSTAAHAADDVPAWARNAPGGVHRVTAGDNLWDIAEHRLGDPHRWREIYVLNRGHEQANGYALSDPDEIHIGWVLALPAHEGASPHPGKGPAEPAEPAPADTVPAPGGSAATSPSPPASPAPATPAPSSTVTAPGTAAPTVDTSAPSEHTESHTEQQVGITLPSQGWISLGLAATIAAVAALLRLHRRRFARLSSPIPVWTGPAPSPVPPELVVADAAGRSDLEPGVDPESFGDRPRRRGSRPVTPAVAAPIGVDAAGAEVSLFDLPGPGLSLTGPGAEPTARAVLASTLATGVLDEPASRPVVVTTVSLLTRLLPEGVEATGLDPHGVTYDGERLLVLADTGNAVSHAEEEMIARRRILDTFDQDTITALNARTDHAEIQPPYVVLLDAADRYAGRLVSVAAHQKALHLYVVVLGTIDGIAAATVAPDGTATEVLAGGRLATLAPPDLAQLLAMISDAAARPEPGTDVEVSTEPAVTDDTVGDGKTDDEPPAAVLDPVPDLPASTGDATPLARLSVLGPVTVTTDNGPITTGLRSGSYAVLAVLAAHPHGRTLDEIAADVHPGTDPVAAIKRLRTDITTIRRVVRAASGASEAMFILYNGATGRYRIDPDAVEVDLWRMLTAIGRANTSSVDTDALAALREAADLYGGDFAEGQDQSWVTDYATTSRLQILNVYARIAELLETDQPDAAIASLEQALRHDPLNEEIYQRIMRIQGRLSRLDAVRRTIRRLEDQLAELGGAEPSEATRRVAARQLQMATSGVRP